MCPERVTGTLLRDLLRADIGTERRAVRRQESDPRQLKISFEPAPGRNRPKAGHDPYVPRCLADRRSLSKFETICRSLQQFAVVCISLQKLAAGGFSHIRNVYNLSGGIL